MLQNFVFFDGSIEAPTTTPVKSNELGLYANAGAMMLHVESNDVSATPSSINFAVEASLDLENKNKGVDNFYTVSVVNMTTFETSQAITGTGIYMVVFPGATRVRLKSTVAIDTKLKVYGITFE